MLELAVLIRTWRRRALSVACLFTTMVCAQDCGRVSNSPGELWSSTGTAPVSAASVTPKVSGSTVRPGFLGAFFRPQGAPPFGVFSVYSKQRAPEPYPTPGTRLFGAAGYCDAVSDNGESVSGGFLVDHQKLANIVDLGVSWARIPAAPFFDDLSHILGAGQYTFGDLDAAQCALARHHITPVVAVEPGSVQYNAIPGQYSPHTLSLYKTAKDFATWCGAVTSHERKVFPNVLRFTSPGNEVNNNAQLFPGGEQQIAAYSVACYRAIKAANPKAFVYGFELSMDGSLDVPAFVRRLAGLGCGLGSCYDGIAIHLSLRYPLPSASTPCYPNRGGDYSMECATDVERAAGVKHLLISETQYPVPGSVADEAAKAVAIVAEFRAFAGNPTIDGVLYANVDECDLYASGYFVGGCLVNAVGKKLPAYFALRALARRDYALGVRL